MVIITNTELGWDCVVALVSGSLQEAVEVLNQRTSCSNTRSQWEEIGYFFHSKEPIRMEAPEGTTHIDTSDNSVSRWMRKDGKDWYYWNCEWEFISPQDYGILMPEAMDIKSI